MSKAKRYYKLVGVAPEKYISQIGGHRFGLAFESKNPLSGKSVAVIQMNGSKAGPTGKGNAWNVDSTIGKVLCWCYEKHYDLVPCLNLFSHVDPKPENLTQLDLSNLNLDENDRYIKEVCSVVDTVIVAYGDCKGIDPEIVEIRTTQVLSWFERVDLYNVGKLTKFGNPRHGRSWNNSPKLSVFRQKIG